MERTYKNATIAKNLNGKWVVLMDGHGASQHNTLADAKDHVSRIVEMADF